MQRRKGEKTRKDSHIILRTFLCVFMPLRFAYCYVGLFVNTSRRQLSILLFSILQSLLID